MPSACSELHSAKYFAPCRASRIATLELSSFARFHFVLRCFAMKSVILKGTHSLAGDLTGDDVQKHMFTREIHQIVFNGPNYGVIQSAASFVCFGVASFFMLNIFVGRHFPLFICSASFRTLSYNWRSESFNSIETSSFKLFHRRIFKFSSQIKTNPINC